MLSMLLWQECQEGFCLLNVVGGLERVCPSPNKLTPDTLPFLVRLSTKGKYPLRYGDARGPAKEWAPPKNSKNAKKSQLWRVLAQRLQMKMNFYPIPFRGLILPGHR